MLYSSSMYLLRGFSQDGYNFLFKCLHLNFEPKADTSWLKKVVVSPLLGSVRPLFSAMRNKSCGVDMEVKIHVAKSWNRPLGRFLVFCRFMLLRCVVRHANDALTGSGGDLKISPHPSFSLPPDQFSSFRFNLTFPLNLHSVAKKCYAYQRAQLKISRETNRQICSS